MDGHPFLNPVHGKRLRVRFDVLTTTESLSEPGTLMCPPEQVRFDLTLSSLDHGDGQEGRRHPDENWTYIVGTDGRW